MSEVHILMPSETSNKFDTCRHRSPQEITKMIKRCSCQGGNYAEKGFLCLKRSIFKVEPNFCQACDQYESK
jgi:hypothetical protein